MSYENNNRDKAINKAANDIYDKLNYDELTYIFYIVDIIKKFKITTYKSLFDRFFYSLISAKEKIKEFAEPNKITPFIKNHFFHTSFIISAF